MKITLLSTATAALLVGGAAAFPSNMDSLLEPAMREAVAEKKRQLVGGPQGDGALPLVPPPFDAERQFVSNQGEHAFVAPGPGDERGPCPGLNAMANHGYLPHDGRATIQQFIDGTQEVFGMANNLGRFLSVYGALVNGDGTSWSINGGPRIGIGGSHNNYETDSSPLKGDLEQYGDNGQLILSQYNELVGMQPADETANYNLEVLREFRGKRYAESIAKNPNFAYLPFGGIAVSQAAFTFIYRFMANKSAEFPEGVLSKAVLDSFNAIEGTDENPVWNRGHERIPDNWYKRHPDNEYSTQFFVADILYFAETQPEILQIGCNQGRVNSFNAIDPATLATGANVAQQLADNPLCFATQFVKFQLPRLTGLRLLDSLLSPLRRVLDDLLANQDCDSVGEVDNSALLLCPGFSLYGGPTAPVAEGAIQS